MYEDSTEIKDFCVVPRKGVILTKDNLVKRNWNGSTRCAFCTHDETIKHLFFQCKVARSIWPAIQIASNLYPPRSVTNIFDNCLNGVDSRLTLLFRVGAIDVIWSLWLCRNDKVFNDKNTSLMQVIYLTVYGYDPFMVTSTACGASQPVYGGVFAFGGCGMGFFLPAWMAT